jgi:hypothetical protein
MRTEVSERIPVVTTKCSARHAFGLRRPSGGPTYPDGLCFVPFHPALWDECRQSSALTAGRPGEAQPVSFHSDETGVAIVAECCMPQVMPTSRSGFAERLTRQRIEANPSRTAGAATIDGRADTVACTRLGFATVPRLAIPQRGKAWRDWARRSAMALMAGRCRGNRLA